MSKASDAARALGKRRWSGTTKAERSEAMAKLSKRRNKAKLTAHLKKIAKLRKPISPEAAKARALKAWETRRSNQAKAEQAGK